VIDGYPPGASCQSIINRVIHRLLQEVNSPPVKDDPKLPTSSAAFPAAELEARLRLHRLPDIGPKGFHQLLEAFGSARAALAASASAWRAQGRTQASIEARESADAMAGAEAASAG